MDLLSRDSKDCNCVSKHFKTATYVLALLFFIALWAAVVASWKLFQAWRRDKYGIRQPLKSDRRFNDPYYARNDINPPILMPRPTQYRRPNPGPPPYDDFQQQFQRANTMRRPMQVELEEAEAGMESDAEAM